MEKKYIKLFMSHGFGQVVTICTNLLLPAVLIRSWGGGDFALWVSANALAQFFLVSDLGINNAGANHFFLRERGADLASLFYQIKSILLKRIVCSFFVAAVFSCAACLLGAPQGSNDYASIFYVNFLLSGIVCMTCGLQILTTAYRCVGRLEVGVFVQNLLRLIDFIAWVILAGFVGFVFASVIIFFFKLMQVVFFFRRLKEIIPPPLVGSNNCDHAEELEKVNSAGLGFARIQTAQTVALHGLTLAIAYKFDPNLAMIFNLSRTITRLPIQPLSIINQTLAPELTARFGVGDFLRYRKLILSLLFFALTACVVYLLFLTLFHNWFFRLWVGNASLVPFDVFFLIALGSLFNISSYCVSASLAASNNTSLQSKFTLALSMMSVGFVILFPIDFGYGNCLGVLLFFEVIGFCALSYFLWRHFSQIKGRSPSSFF